MHFTDIVSFAASSTLGKRVLKKSYMEKTVIRKRSMNSSVFV